MGTIFIFVGVWDYCVNVYEIVSFVVDSLDETDGVLYMFFFYFRYRTDEDGFCY